MICNTPKHHLWFGMAFLALSVRATAGTESVLDTVTPLYQPLITLTLGPDFVQQGRAQTLTPLPPFQKYYTNAHPSTTVLDGGGFIGVEHAFSNKLWGQLGISGYGDTQMSPKGDVWLFASPVFNTLSYAYHVHHARVMAEGKFLTTLTGYQLVRPYVSWGLGAAFNQASAYQETARIQNAIPAPPFANHTQTAFTWSAGVGVDCTVTPNIRLGMGYQFADLGSVSLGPTPAATTTQSLSFSHLYANQLRFQFTFLV